MMFSVPKKLRSLYVQIIHVLVISISPFIMASAKVKSVSFFYGFVCWIDSIWEKLFVSLVNVMISWVCGANFWRTSCYLQKFFFTFYPLFPLHIYSNHMRSTPHLLVKLWCYTMHLSIDDFVTIFVFSQISQRNAN